MSHFGRVLKWAKRNLAILVIVGALFDTGVFAVQGWQIGTLNSQQHQINRLAEHGNCWANVLDKAIREKHATKASKANLVKLASECRVYVRG